MISGLFRGFLDVFKAPAILTKYRLWTYAYIPIALSIFLFIAVFGTVWGLSENLSRLLFGWWKWEFGKNFIDKIDHWISALLILTLAASVFKYTLLILLSPFMSMLSAKLETAMYGHFEPPTVKMQFLSDFIRGLRINLRNLFLELLYTLLLFALSFVPSMGFVTPVLLFFMQGYYAGFGNFDFTLERHFDIKNSCLYTKQHRSYAIGNGSALLLSLIPIVGVLIGPLFTAVSASHYVLVDLYSDNS